MASQGQEGDSCNVDHQPSSDSGKKSGKKPKENLRVVVRRLPPALPEHIFLKSIEPFQDQITDFYYIIGDKTLENNCFARAYMKFKTRESMVSFAAMYDGHIFRNKQGVEHQAVVELAPYQRNLKEKQDPRRNTYENDTHYQFFLSNLNKPPDPLPNVEKWLQQKENSLKETEALAATTPLQLYLMEKAAGSRKKRKEKTKDRKATSKGSKDGEVKVPKEKKNKMKTTASTTEDDVQEKQSAHGDRKHQDESKHLEPKNKNQAARLNGQQEKQKTDKTGSPGQETAPKALQEQEQAIKESISVNTRDNSKTKPVVSSAKSKSKDKLRTGGVYQIPAVRRLLQQQKALGDENQHKPKNVVKGRRSADDDADENQKAKNRKNFNDSNTAARSAPRLLVRIGTKPQDKKPDDANGS
eukprot:gene10140-2305_t